MNTNLQSWLGKTGLAVLAFFSPVHSLMIAAGALVVLDFVTGVWAAMKQKKPITSEAMRRTVVKMCVYQAAIIGAFFMETLGIQDIVPVTKLVGVFIALTEGKSFFENIHIITGNDLIKQIIDKLHRPRDEKK